MPSLAWSEPVILENWIDQETRHLDLVASWETLLNVYEVLSFLDPINDEIRLTEFKDIIAETNKFLSRMRKGMKTIKDLDSAIEFLKKQADTKDVNQIKTRSTLAYNKLRQRWVVQSITQLTGLNEQLYLDREEGTDD
jgi:hypothetical protein